MIVIPAVDLRDGACVQLVGGSYDNERIRLDDPPSVARRWEYEGFKHLHVVDLDAATGRGSNRDTVSDILHATSMDIQVGGGVRELSDVESLIGDGAQRVVVGTRGIEDADWLDEVAHTFPQQIIVAADVRDRRVVTRGWGQLSNRTVMDVVQELNAFPLAGIMVTAVHKEGQMLGTDLPLMEDVAEESDFPVYASGGITSIADLHALDDRGVAGAIIGMALYTGALSAHVVAEEFGSDD
jgi:phosphoribosylformimino-5-aminoimidazole carboxamide ribotide isomerase